MEHRKREEERDGQEICPAVPKLADSMTQRFVEEDQFCSNLEASSCMSRPELVW